jgi:hypothetical protein
MPFRPLYSVPYPRRPRHFLQDGHHVNMEAATYAQRLDGWTKLLARVPK